MELVTKAIKGTQDILPKDSRRWQFVEDIMRSEAQAFNYSEIRTPVFENTELFCRSVGDTTDVVQKEMFTFCTKGGDNITLRPEGTAGAARAILENGVYNDGYPIKTYYITSCYRYERPEKGRLREFHQFGVEVYGAPSYLADAEIITMAKSIFDRLGIRDLSLQINSIGCPLCRANYHKALGAYLGERRNCLCGACLSRLDRNPMRVLDCKTSSCSRIAKDAPTTIDYLCEECRTHFEGVKDCLDAAQIEYTVNPRIVRGLDYYSKTVFEFVSNSIGAQGTVCGGGRYDGLIEELGGARTPSLGFGMGLERLLLLMDAQGVEIPPQEPCAIYFVGLGDKAKLRAFRLACDVREATLSADCDIVGRSLKAQMKYADKIGAVFTMVIGDAELESGQAKLKNMKTGEQTDMPVDDSFVDKFIKIYVTQYSHENILSSLTEEPPSGV